MTSWKPTAIGPDGRMVMNYGDLIGAATEVWNFLFDRDSEDPDREEIMNEVANVIAWAEGEIDG